MKVDSAGALLALGGRRALVTGGSRGIGAATALLLARSGARVVIAYRSRAADAERVAASVRAAGAEAWTVAGDLTSETEAERVVADAHARLGGLDLFVGNAGVWPTEEMPLTALSTERWRQTLRENLDGLFFSTRAALRRLSNHGRVVLVSSTAGQRGEALHADYAATKGAVISLTKSLAVEAAPRGITVNCVAPGWVETEMVADVLALAREQIASAIPLGRVASPEDIAGPIAFLCSDLARHVTGEILNVNGGSVLCG